MIIQKELLDFSYFIDNNLRICVEMDSNVWDNGRRNIKLDQAKFIDMGTH